VPGGAGEVDAGAVGDQRATLGDELTKRGDLVAAREPPSGGDDSPPRHCAAIGRHDCADGSRAAAAEVLGHHVSDGSVRHCPSGRDALHQPEHRLDVLVVHRPIVPLTNGPATPSRTCYPTGAIPGQPWKHRNR
jgi:hypothetical protein